MSAGDTNQALTRPHPARGPYIVGTEHKWCNERISELRGALTAAEAERDELRAKLEDAQKDIEQLSEFKQADEEISLSFVNRARNAEAKLARIREAWEHAGSVPSRDMKGSRDAYKRLKAAIEDEP
jgi:chromosome segregation ATPase